MSRTRSVFIALSAAAAAGLVGIALVPTATAATTTYYVDCAGGNDSAAGTSTTTAWGSLAKVSATTFKPGDQILLKRGTSCTGTLAPKGSGTAGAPISVDAYGTGAKPVVAGGGATRAVSLSNQQWWEIRNLEVTNKGTSVGNRRGVSVELSDYGTGSHYVLENLDIHDVNGDDTKDLDGSGGIYFAVRGNAVQTKFDGITIRNNTIRSVDREGIFFVSTWNRSSFEATSAGTFVPWPNVAISGNDLSDLGGDGIVPGNTTGALIEYNKVTGFQKRSAHYNAGMWPYDSDNAVFQYNEASGGASTRDGMAYDVDQGTVGTVFQYNYSHDNAGGFLLLCNASGILRTAVVRYNISQNDSYRGVENCSGTIESAEISNNTIYIGPGISQTVINENNTTRRNVVFRNNIIVKTGTGPASMNLHGGGYLLDHNALVNVSGVPSGGGITADPKLAAPGTATSRAQADGYKLCATSPALAAGSTAVRTGTQDYYGNTLPATPNIGAHAGTGVTCGTGSVTSGTTYTVGLAGTAKSVDVPASSTAPGTQLSVWTTHGGDNQRFTFTAQTDGSYTVENVNSGLCMDVTASSPNAGAAIVQWTCTGNPNQRWRINAVTGGYSITSVSSGLLLTSGGTSDGASLTQQVGPASATTQTWNLTAA